MKKKRIVALAIVATLMTTGVTVIPAPSASAEEYGFAEDFERYEVIGETYSAVDAMDDLYADGWSVVVNNEFAERNADDMNQQFAQIVSDGGNQVLALSGDQVLGRMLDLGNETPAGSYEIKFRMKPTDSGKFDFSLGSFHETGDAQKHNLLYADTGMRMGHRLNSVNVPMTQVGNAENVWYDVKCIVNNDGGYYSVELYKEGEAVARRGVINYAGDEFIGYLSLGGNGSTVYLDDLSIVPCEQETLIYEDNFDSYEEVKLPASLLPVGATVTEARSMGGDSFFEGYTPWRALNVFGNNYGLEDDDTLGSQVVRLGDDPQTPSVKEQCGMTFMPLDGDILTKESQTKRGRLKLTYKFRHASNCSRTAIDLLSDYQLKNVKNTDYVAQMAIMGRPTAPYLYLPNAKFSAINSTIWYEAEIIFDVINDEVTITVRDSSTGGEFAHFTHHTNWINTSQAPVADKIKAINFRAAGGSTIYIDDVKLEYLITKPEISGSSIVMTDYKGEEVTDRKNVPVAIKSIFLPFGSEMTPETTNADTVTLADSKGNLVNYTPKYDVDSYTLITNGFLTPGETYTLTIPETVSNTFGRELGMDVEYTFKTAPEYPDFMVLRSASLTDLDDLRSGDEITAVIEYANSSDASLSSLPFVAFYGDDMLLATQSVSLGSIGVGEMGTKTVSFTVPTATKLDLGQVDHVALCLWKGFENSAPYGGAIDVPTQTASATGKQTGEKPVLTYSYRDSLLNISGKADTDSKYLTVQILKPGNTFEAADQKPSAQADAMVFYRAQVPVTDGEYSLDVRFDRAGNTQSTLEAGEYPAAVYLDDTKIFADNLYFSSYADFESVYDELNRAASEGDLTKFIDILNTKRSALNLNNELLGDTPVDDSIKPYFEYVKKNPLQAENEETNAQMFDSYVVIQYLNGGKIDNVKDYIGKLLVADDLKTLCNQVLNSNQKGKYFTSLISQKNIDTPEKLEQCINEALILTAARYGNGYGELKTVLEYCGEKIGIEKPISVAATRAMIGKTYTDAKTFKSEYDKNKETSSSGSSSGSSSSSGSGKTTLGTAELPLSGGTSGANPPTPIAKTFTDIDNYEWAMTGILALADRGIINGVSEDRFDPSRNITREEFVKILVGALGLSDYAYQGNRFSDASAGDWFTKYINIAAELGIVQGIGDGKFGVGANITRQDMAVMLYNALKYRNANVETDQFRFQDDGEIASYAKEAVSALHHMGAINGMTETTFAPTGFATRAQAAKIVYSVLSELQRK